jgi:hypothetical protein
MARHEYNSEVVLFFFFSFLKQEEVYSNVKLHSNKQLSTAKPAGYPAPNNSFFLKTNKEKKQGDGAFQFQTRANMHILIGKGCQFMQLIELF